VSAFLDRISDQIDRVIPIEILVILIILGVIIFVWDLLMRQSNQLKTSGGLTEKSQLVAVSGSTKIPGRVYSSAELGLSSQPHSLIKEEGFLIPVDVVPSSKKVKDRHVVQMLVHMRLVETIEGKRPPYGILILGKEQRSVRIKNTDEKQSWLDDILGEMRSILGGVPAVAKPSYYKCKGCDVRDYCQQTPFKDFAPNERQKDEKESIDEDGESNS